MLGSGVYSLVDFLEEKGNLGSMEEGLSGFGVILIIAVISLSLQVHKLNQKIAACSDAIEKANSQMEVTNSSISEAQDVVWEDYETMGNAIDDLTYSFPVDNLCLDLKK